MKLYANEQIHLNWTALQRNIPTRYLPIQLNIVYLYNVYIKSNAENIELNNERATLPHVEIFQIQ